jgi:hypothetical protein
VEDLFYAMRVDRPSRYCIVTEFDIAVLNRLEVLRDSARIMERVVAAFANVEQDVELTLAINNANIPDLKSTVLVMLWECTHWLWHPQRVSIVSML